MPEIVRDLLPGVPISDELAEGALLPRRTRLGQLDASWAELRTPDGRRPVPRTQLTALLLTQIAPTLMGLSRVRPFAGFDDETPDVDTWPLSTRATNCMRRAGLRGQALPTVTVADLLAIQGSGLRTTLELLCVGEAVNELEAPRTDPADLLSRALAGLSDRHVELFTRRMVADRPETLKAIGDEWGLTRERIRQLQAQVQQRLDVTFKDRALAELLDEVRAELGALAQVDDTAEEIVERHARALGSPDLVTARGLLLLMARYQRRDGWYRRHDAPPQDRIREAVRAATDADGFLTTDAAAVALDALDVRPLWHLPLLADACALKPVDGGWLRWDGTIADRLHRLLCRLGRPMTPEELLAASGEPHDPRASRSQLLDDDRVVRVDREGRVAPVGWGLPAYGGIVAAMREMIRARGGYLALEAAVTELTSQFEVAAASVRAYADAPCFVLLDVGLLRLRRPDEPLMTKSWVGRRRGVFCKSEQIAIVIPMVHEVYRGSSRTTSHEVAAALGVTMDGERTFDAGGGWAITVRAQSTALTATIGSLRTLADHLGAVIGDHLVLRFDPVAGTVAFRRLIRSDPLEVWTAALFGPNTEGLEDLAASLRVDDTPAAVGAALRARKEPLPHP